MAPVLDPAFLRVLPSSSTVWLASLLKAERFMSLFFSLGPLQVAGKDGCLIVEECLVKESRAPLSPRTGLREQGGLPISRVLVAEKVPMLRGTSGGIESTVFPGERLFLISTSENDKKEKEMKDR